MNNKKVSIKKDTLFVYTGHFLRYLSPLILIPYYSRILGPNGYGQLLAALSLMALVSVVVSYGFIFSGIRDAASAADKSELSSILGQQIYGRILLIPIAFAIGVIGTYYSPILQENIWFGALATMLGILQAFGFSWFFQGIRKFKKSIILESIAYPLNIFFILTLVHNSNDGLMALVALFISSILYTLISLIFVFKETLPNFNNFKSGIKEIRETTIFFITSMSFTILTVGSTYILSTTVPSDEVGFFGTAERFISLALGLLNPISQVLMPTISNLYKKGDKEAFPLIRKGLLFESSYGVLGLLGGFFLAPFFIPLFLGKAFFPTVTLFQLMLFLLPFAALKHAIIMYILIPMKQEKYYLWTSLLNVCLSICFALILIPSMGATGMAISRLISEIIATIFLILILMKISTIRQHLKLITQKIF